MGTIDPAYFELMPTLVIWNRFLSEDQYGNNTYGEDIAMRVRMEPFTLSLNVGTSQAGAVMADVGKTVMIICDLTSPRVAAQDRMTIVDGDLILRVESAMVQYDENGPYYQELQCKNSEDQQEESP